MTEKGTVIKMLNTKIQSISNLTKLTKNLAAAAFLVSLALGLNFISASTGTAKANVLLGKIVENRDFFISYDGSDVNDYEKSLLCDVSDLGANRIGLLLLEPSGFLKSLVFNRGALAKVHEDINLPGRTLRNELARSAISISDARLVAKNIAGFSTERMNAANNNTDNAEKKSVRRKAVPQEAVIPQTPPAVVSSDERQKRPTGAKEVLTQLREEVSQNTEVSAMNSEEIIRRFRSEIQEAKRP